MTRKRFVKLLMSYGYQRNQANTYAKIARSSGSYKKFFIQNHFIFSLNRTGESIKSVGKTLKQFAENAVKVVKPVINDFISAISYGFAALHNTKNEPICNNDALDETIINISRTTNTSVDSVRCALSAWNSTNNCSDNVNSDINAGELHGR